MTIVTRTLAGAFGLALLGAPAALAAVTAQDAEQLKTTLTPTGGLKTGNGDGTIPAWTGGCPPTGDYIDGRLPPDPYAGDKPLFTITKANMGQYAAKLNDGARYMLENYPGYKIVVYPSRRSYCAPQSVYDATFRNATTAKLSPDGNVASNWKGGIPFPIVKRGEEAIWNQQYTYRGVDAKMTSQSYYTSASGARSLVQGGTFYVTYPPYYPDGREDPWKGEYQYMNRGRIVAPASAAGNAMMFYAPLDNMASQQQTWIYQQGQRRLRKFPQANYDTPNTTVGGGLTNFDDALGYSGMPDRYDVTLVGRQEFYIPYNNNGLSLEPNIDKVLGPSFANPDLVRYELHRVWVVDMKLKAGARHVVTQRRLYIDEDSSILSVTDQWSADGKLWKSLIGTMFYYPKDKVAMLGVRLAYDLQAGGYVAFTLNNVAPGAVVFGEEAKKPASYFTPAAVSAEGLD
ncbi:DUF1329 domain-containing protein [Azospirillum griseum]|uniref:DUF1329 domain-containing protein n=1 Tax=Azospirillum griseum TaxID=2496639 RepID=A0A431VAR5_9PROT|nr:DUF1329 domain-containing protein [Azospirillum griseum]RTR14616.1 DUF1329 domain-containing protein [Azospirillum griseum]